MDFGLWTEDDSGLPTGPPSCLKVLGGVGWWWPIRSKKHPRVFSLWLWALTWDLDSGMSKYYSLWPKLTVEDLFFEKSINTWIQSLWKTLYTGHNLFIHYLEHIWGGREHLLKLIGVVLSLLPIDCLHYKKWQMGTIYLFDHAFNCRREWGWESSDTYVSCRQQPGNQVSQSVGQFVLSSYAGATPSILE